MFFTSTTDNSRGMNRRFPQSMHQIRVFCPYLLNLVARVVFLIGTAGCASHHPVPLLVTHPVPERYPTPTGEDMRLEVVTYNIWGLPSWMTGAGSGRYALIERELERLDPDIILLQEAWTAKARKSAPSNGRWAIACAAGQRTFFQQCGLMTLSKFPIIGGKFYPFSRAAFPDRCVNKGALKVTVQLQPGLVLNIWNVHLQDGGPPEIRESQIRELVSWVRGAEDQQIADVVGGDFNCTPSSHPAQELESSLGPSVLQLGKVEPFVTWDGLSSKPGAGQTLDYIFVHRRAGVQRLQAAPRVAFTAAQKRQRLSDHLAVESVVNFNCRRDLAGRVGPQLQSALIPSAATMGELGD